MGLLVVTMVMLSLMVTAMRASSVSIAADVTT
jgi:hypothetical protein